MSARTGIRRSCRIRPRTPPSNGCRRRSTAVPWPLARLGRPTARPNRSRRHPDPKRLRFAAPSGSRHRARQSRAIPPPSPNKTLAVSARPHLSIDHRNTDTGHGRALHPRSPAKPIGNDSHSPRPRSRAPSSTMPPFWISRRRHSFGSGLLAVPGSPARRPAVFSSQTPVLPPLQFRRFESTATPLPGAPGIARFAVLRLVRLAVLGLPFALPVRAACLHGLLAR